MSILLIDPLREPLLQRGAPAVATAATRWRSGTSTIAINTVSKRDALQQLQRFSIAAMAIARLDQIHQVTRATTQGAVRPSGCARDPDEAVRRVRPTLRPTG